MKTPPTYLLPDEQSAPSRHHPLFYVGIGFMIGIWFMIAVVLITYPC